MPATALSAVSPSTLVVGALLYAATLVVYRLCFHPLARFPGPKLAAATKWYEFYFDIVHGQGGRFAFELDRLHDQYGPILRVNPDELHVRDAAFYDTLYGAVGAVRDKWPPAARMAGTSQGTFGTVLHHTHRQRRSAITSLFSKKTVAAHHRILRAHVESLGAHLGAAAGSGRSVELRTTYLAFATDVTSDYGFGSSWGLLHDDKRAVEWRESISAVAYFTLYAKQLPWLLPIAKTLPIPLLARFSPALGRVIRLFSETRSRADDARRNRHVSRPDSVRPAMLFHEILSSSLREEEKSSRRMSEEGVVILSAGSETISRTLTSGTFHVLDNPGILAALKKELSMAMPDRDAIPSLSDLERLPFLTAVIKESLRLACNTTSRLPIVSPKTPLQYGDWHIPAGIPVGMTPHKTLTDPNVFSRPLEFEPSRWLGPEEDVRRMSRSFVPFGRGNRMCLGINLANAELYMVFATLFRRFDFSLDGVLRERDIDVTRDCFVGEPSRESPGVRVQVRLAPHERAS